MILKNIKIQNYKSIKCLEIPINDFSEKYLSFLGVNEAGKTSILEAINLKSQTENFSPNYSKYCHRPSQLQDRPISLEFRLKLDSNEVEQLKSELYDAGTTSGLVETKEAESKKAVLDELTDLIESEIVYSFQINNLSEITEDIYHLDSGNEINVTSYFPDNFVIPIVEFWKGSVDELIPDEITISEIANESNKPFNNCLKIAGLKKDSIQKALGDGGRQSELQEQLTIDVTSYLNKRWPEHEVKIEFHVADERVTCRVVDVKNSGRQRIAPSARSDGFKKLISFLLSLSIDYSKNQVSNSILLLDEPEMFLHPEAQQNFRDELISIASKNNNVVMCSTHSMYMIHKEHIDHCFSVKKIADNKAKEFKTEIQELSPQVMSFARINFSVFNIATTEYHSELYGRLQVKYIDSVAEPSRETYTAKAFDEKYFPSTRRLEWKRMAGSKQITVPVSIHSYIRHSIHHPENNLGNIPFTEEELRSSIVEMEKLLFEQ